MKLSVRDAAKLLNASERDVYRWIRQDAIPFHRVHDDYRFHRAELLEWATQRGIGVAAEAFPMSRRDDPAAPDLAPALQSGGVHHRVPGDDRASVLRAMVERAPIGDDADRELLFEVTLAREELSSTGIGDGIAIPHPRAPIVLRATPPAIALCFLEHSLDFDAIDGKPVDTLFWLISPTVRTHLHLLSRLSGALADAEFKAAVAARASAESIVAAAARVDEHFFARNRPQ